MPTSKVHAGNPNSSGCNFCMSRHRGICDGVSELDQEARSALEAAHAAIRVYDAGEVVYAQGDPVSHTFNLISGWVALHRDMRDGRRQITEFILPGGLFGLGAGGTALGHGATCITNASACPIPLGKLAELRLKAPALNERYIALLQRQHARMFEALTTIGQGSAKERIASLFADLCATVAHGRHIQPGEAFWIPLTQRHIAEATGQTPIHVNRVMRQLREDRLLEHRNGYLIVLDPGRLDAFVDQDRERETPTATSAIIARGYFRQAFRRPGAALSAASLPRG